MTAGRYKTFLATKHVVGGPVSVVLLEHAAGNWAAYISTDTTMSVQDAPDNAKIREQFERLLALAA